MSASCQERQEAAAACGRSWRRSQDEALRPKGGKENRRCSLPPDGPEEVPPMNKPRQFHPHKLCEQQFKSGSWEPGLLKMEDQRKLSTNFFGFMHLLEKRVPKSFPEHFCWACRMSFHQRVVLDTSPPRAQIKNTPGLGGRCLRSTPSMRLRDDALHEEHPLAKSTETLKFPEQQRIRNTFLLLSIPRKRWTTQA